MDRELIGQLFFANLPGDSLTPESLQFLQETRPGGIVLYGENIRSARQIQELTQELQRRAAEWRLPPLILAVDEEGGRVSRMPGGLEELIAPSQMAQAAAGGDAVAAAATATARRLRRLGFTMNLAPVADINTHAANPIIGSRAYGNDPAAVGAAVAAAVRAYLAEGIVPCVKHFPGHGDTEVDSHFATPLIKKTLPQMQQTNLIPFVQALAAGAPAIQMARIVCPAVDPTNTPANVSPYFLNTLLRQHLGFTGLVLTGALLVEGQGDRLHQAAVIQQAVMAGACLLIPTGANWAPKYEHYQALVAAAETAAFDVAAAVTRVLDHKARYLQPLLAVQAGPLPAGEAGTQVTDEKATMLAIARRAITVLRNEGALLPLAPARFHAPLLVDFVLPVASPIEESRPVERVLQKALLARIPQLQIYTGGANPTRPETDAVLARAATADLLIIITHNALQIPAQAALTQHLLTLGIPAVLVAARDPYDCLIAPNAPAQVVTYGDPPVSMLALAEVLVGQSTPTGILPVDIPDLHPRGSGLSWPA